MVTYFLVSESKNPNSQFIKQYSPAGIIFLLVWRIVNTTIHLYHQTRIMTIEISDEITNGMLCFKPYAP